MNPKKKTAIIIFVVALVIALILLFFLTQGQSSEQVNNTVPTTVVADSTTVSIATTTTTTTSVQSVPPPPPVDTSKYKNGTYTATGKYFSPAGPENIGVSLTISNDIVTASSVTPLATDGRSMDYQGMFINSYKQYVVGKNIDSINLTGDISGSSLTPRGFDDALTTIKGDALAS